MSPLHWGVASRGESLKSRFCSCTTTDITLRRSQRARQHAALLRHVVAEWTGERDFHLRLPRIDAIQPTACGLRGMASAQQWGHMRTPCTCHSTAPVAAISPNLSHTDLAHLAYLATYLSSRRKSSNITRLELRAGVWAGCGLSGTLSTMRASHVCRSLGIILFWDLAAWTIQG